MKQRIEWVDYARGIGIVLVVYAHLLSSGYHAGLDIAPHFFQLSDSFVYSFHMPLFFFLAGLFAAASYEKRGGRYFLLQKIKNLFYPYLFWSLIQASVELFFAGHSYRGGSLEQFLLIPVLPWAQFWFLYAILLMYLCFFVLRLMERYGAPVMTLVAVLLFFKPIHSEYFGLAGFSTGFLFFMAGFWLKPYCQNLGKMKKAALAFMALFFTFVALAYVLFSYYIAPTRLPGGLYPFCFIILAVLGIAACLFLSIYLAQHAWLSFLTVLGKYSLQIYLVHMLAGVATRIVLQGVFHVTNPLLHMVIGVAVALAAPVFMAMLVAKFHIPYLFAWDSGRYKAKEFV
jgi:fucose 4-O-acetylase-like acetyltransferase